MRRPRARAFGSWRDRRIAPHRRLQLARSVPAAVFDPRAIACRTPDDACVDADDRSCGCLPTEGGGLGVHARRL